MSLYQRKEIKIDFDVSSSESGEPKKSYEKIWLKIKSELPLRAWELKVSDGIYAVFQASTTAPTVITGPESSWKVVRDDSVPSDVIVASIDKERDLRLWLSMCKPEVFGEYFEATSGYEPCFRRADKGA